MKNQFLRALWATLASGATLFLGAPSTSAQVIMPPREATQAQVAAGTAGNVYVSPRRLAGGDITTGDIYVSGDDIFGVLGLNVTASQTTDKNLTLKSTGTGNVVIKHDSTTMATFNGTNNSTTLAGALTLSGAITSSGVLTANATAATITGNTTIAGGLLLGNATGGMPAAGVLNAEGLKINGVDVATSSDTYWTADAPGIKYVAGPVSLKGTPTGDAGDMQVEDLTADSINPTVTLGTSGPQLSSSLNSKSPAAGLVFDGTAGATVSGVPAFGTGDFSIVAWANPTTQVNNAGVAGASDNDFFSILNGNGKLETNKVVSTTAGTVGKVTMWAIVRGSSLQTIYRDGIADSAATADATNYTTALNEIGANTAFGTKLIGTLRVQIYNRALSAAEVLALAESGAASGADYNSASNTGMIGASYATFTDATGWGLGAGNSIDTGAGTLTMADGAYVARSLSLTKGRRYRVEFTASAATGTFLVYNGSAFISTGLTASGIYELTMAADYASVEFKVTGGTATLTDFQVYPLGLLLSPDYTVGSGLTVPPQNGTSGTVTLPASGVTWSQPNGNLISLGTTAGSQATIAGDAAGGLTVTPKDGYGFTVTQPIFPARPNNDTLGLGSVTFIAGYNQFRQGTDNSFNLDQYFSGGFKNSLKLLNGNATLYGNLTASGSAYFKGATSTLFSTAGLSFLSDSSGRGLRFGTSDYDGGSTGSSGTLEFSSGTGTATQAWTAYVGGVAGAQLKLTGGTGGGVEVTGAITATSSGSHVFGTGGNTVTLAAGAVTATGNILTGGATAGTYSGDNITIGVKANVANGVGILRAQSKGTVNATAIEVFANELSPIAGLYIPTASTNFKLQVGGTEMLTIAHTTGAATFAGSVGAASISSNTTIGATGNVTGGNITTGGLVSATGNVSGGNITTTGIVSATGNVSGGNITTTGIIVAGNATTTLTDATGKVLSNALNIVMGAQGGTGVANTGKSITLGGNLTTSGAHTTTLTTTANTSITLPTSGTVLSDATTITVAQGGTGLGNLTANNVILGNGTNSVTFVAPGTSGNVLTSNGTTWASAALPSPAFAEIYVADGSTGQSIPTGATYTKLTAFTTDGVSSNCTAAAASDKITITTAGTYRVSWGASITADTNNVTWSLAVYSGGVELHNSHVSRKVGTGADVGDMGRTCIITVSSVPVDLDVRAAHNNVGSVVITPVHMNLNVAKIN